MSQCPLASVMLRVSIAPSTVDEWQLSGEGPIGARPYVRYLAADLPIVYLEYIYITNL
jgi:hypothetical protein